MRGSGSCLITVAPCESQITFGKICRRSHLVGATAILHFSRKHIIGSLELPYHLAEQFLISILIVRGLLPCAVFHHVFIDPWNLTEHCQQLEVKMAAKEMHFSEPLRSGLLTENCRTVFVKSNNRTIATGNRAIKTIP